MATEAFESSRASSGLRTLVNRDAVGALILAGSIPFLFLHERWQPEASVGLGATTIDMRPSDLAVLVVLVAAAVAALREGIASLADDLERSIAAEQIAQSIAEQRMVVGDNNSNRVVMCHAESTNAGNRISTRMPTAPFRGSTTS